MDETKFIDESSDQNNPIKDAQNRILGIFLLFVIAIVLYLTGSSGGIGLFENILILFIFANTLYLVYEVVRLIRLKRDDQDN